MNIVLHEAINSIKQAYAHYQRPFSAQEYKRLVKEKDLVGYDYALYHTRKTWRGLLRLAGVPEVKSGRKPDRVYTKEDILDAIITAAKIHGSFPTLREYRNLVPNHNLPNWRIISTHGTWAELSKEAQSKIIQHIKES